MLLIRETTLEDAPQLADCIDQVARERRYIASTQGHTVEEITDFIAFLRESGGIHLVLIAFGIVAGWCDITPGLFEGLEHTGHLGMGLLPAFRGQGWGKQLLFQALNHAFEQRFERVELEVFSSNRTAVALYQRMGFVEEGRKRMARKLDGGYDDILAFGMLKQDWLKRS